MTSELEKIRDAIGDMRGVFSALDWVGCLKKRHKWRYIESDEIPRVVKYVRPHHGICVFIEPETAVLLFPKNFWQRFAIERNFKKWCDSESIRKIEGNRVKS